jgi:hypothetical protein
VLKKSNCKHCGVVTCGRGTYCRKCSHIYFPQGRKPLIERLREKTIVNGECWEYGGKLTPYGYGDMKIYGENSEYVYRRTHRVSYEIHNPGWDGKNCILHKCDNRKCWNPNHLFQGSHDDNMKDMVSKKRSMTGEKHHMAKLTWVAVAIIRASDETSPALALRFGVSSSAVDLVKWGKTWKAA